MLINNSTLPLKKSLIRVKYSPIIEIAASLYCLARNISHSPFYNNHQSILDTMDLKIKKEYEYLCAMTADWTLAIDLFCHLEQHNIESAKGLLVSFTDVDTAEFIYGLLSGLVQKRTITKLLKQPSQIESWTDDALAQVIDVSFVRRLFAEGDELKRRMALFLEWYWNNIYEDVWRLIGTSEIAQVHIEESLLSRIGDTTYLESCHPSLKIRSNTLSVIDVANCTWDITSLDSIDIMISAFIDTDLLVNHFGSTLTILKYVAIDNPRAHEIGLEDLADFLKAISSPTKFKILEQLYSSPKTTKELAEALNMAPSSISEHLKTLRAAELLYPQRVKNAVYNRFLYENYQAFASYVLNYFSQ